jgi:glycosyltransferase involved in cell wall biosynthesis
MKTNTELPLVTVLMPVYNSELHLKEAIESILNQSYKKIEFLIINDGSTDNSEKIILSYSDSRIRYLKNEINLKLIKTLNLGIKAAKGKYIARMDADDISLSKRIEKQVLYLEKHEEIGILGCDFEIINKNNNDARFNRLIKTVKYPTENAIIKFNLIFNNVILHPATMFKKEIFNVHNIFFEEEYLHVEEYRLWTKYINKTKFANLPETLFLYRVHEKQISSIHQFIQAENALKVQIEYLETLGYKLNKTESTQIVSFLKNNERIIEIPIKLIVNFIKETNTIFKNAEIEKNLNKKLKNLLIESSKINFTLLLSNKIIITQFLKLTLYQKISILKKALNLS